MKIHKIYRDGKLFDEVDNETHHVKQIAQSYARDDQGKTFSVNDEHGEPYYEVTISVSKSWKVKNGPFTTGGMLEERNI